MTVMLNQLYGMAWVYQLVMWVILVQAGYTAAPNVFMHPCA
jgi:hypothetical protein